MKKIHEDETLDTIQQGKIAIIQKKKGWRFSLDSLLLAAFAGPIAKKRVCELGCGNGVVSLNLVLNEKVQTLVGVDIDPDAIDMAQRSAEINGVKERITFQSGDVRQIRTLLSPENFETVIINPPYRKPGTGKISPVPQKACANHEITATIQDFALAASYLLKNRGNLIAIHLSERFLEILIALQSCRLETKRIRFIHSFRNSPSKLFLLQATKGARSGAIVDRPLVIYRKKGIYTAELKSILLG